MTSQTLARVAAIALIAGMGQASTGTAFAEASSVTKIAPKTAAGSVGKGASKNVKPPATTGTGGTGVSELTSWDCKAVGGTVIFVGDNRCGASGKYCRMPDTNAVCIEEAVK